LLENPAVNLAVEMLEKSAEDHPVVAMDGASVWIVTMACGLAVGNSAAWSVDWNR